MHNRACHHHIAILFAVQQLKLVTVFGRPGLPALQASNANESLKFGARVVRFRLMHNESEQTVCELEHLATTADTPVGLQVA